LWFQIKQIQFIQIKEAVTKPEEYGLERKFIQCLKLVITEAEHCLGVLKLVNKYIFEFFKKLRMQNMWLNIGS
jgi:hypothetical protein